MGWRAGVAQHAWADDVDVEWGGARGALRSWPKTMTRDGWACAPSGERRRQQQQQRWRARRGARGCGGHGCAKNVECERNRHVRACDVGGESSSTLECVSLRERAQTAVCGVSRGVHCGAVCGGAVAVPPVTSSRLGPVEMRSGTRSGTRPCNRPPPAHRQLRLIKSCPALLVALGFHRSC